MPNSNKTNPVPAFVIVYLRIIAAITFLLGLGLIFWPSQMVNLFFNSDINSSEFFVRMLGSTLIGYASLNALAAYKAVAHSVDVAIWANLVTLLIASLISLTNAHLFDGFAWLMITQHLVFAAGFGFCAYLTNKKPPLG